MYAYACMCMCVGLLCRWGGEGGRKQLLYLFVYVSVFATICTCSWRRLCWPCPPCTTGCTCLRATQHWTRRQASRRRSGRGQWHKPRATGESGCVFYRAWQCRYISLQNSLRNRGLANNVCPDMLTFIGAGVSPPSDYTHCTVQQALMYSVQCDHCSQIPVV